MSNKSYPTWLPLNHAAALFGLTRQGFHDGVRPHIPAEAVRNAGKRGTEINFPVAHAAYVRAKVEQATPAPDDDDPMLRSGGDSPAMERYREARAGVAEMELAERRAEMVQRDVFLAVLRPAAQAMRGTGDELVRRFGNEAGEIFNEGVNEFEAAADRLIAAHKPTAPVAGGDPHGGRHLLARFATLR